MTKQYPLFNDYDDYGRLKAVCAKNATYEVNQICCGDNFQLFLTNNGGLYSCGSNKFGQLGTREDSDLEAGSGEEENKGDEDDDNDVSLFMNADLKKKVDGLQKRKDQWTPVPVPLDVPSGTAKVRSVAVGAVHAIAILEGDSAVFAWGKNSFGQLGIGQ